MQKDAEIELIFAPYNSARTSHAPSLIAIELEGRGRSDQGTISRLVRTCGFAKHGSPPGKQNDKAKPL
jgi:hypothetical protein